MEKLFTGIEHFAISAHDPQALAEWYGRVMCFNVIVAIDNGPDKPKTYVIGLGRAYPYLEIVPGDRQFSTRDRPNPEPGFSHMAVEVRDFDAAVRHLESQGARAEGAERAAPYGSRVQFYRDPEGNLFHILKRPTLLADVTA